MFQFVGIRALFGEDKPQKPPSGNGIGLVANILFDLL